MMIYTIMDWLGLVSLFICLCFGVQELLQLIKRRSLLKVDPVDHSVAESSSACDRDGAVRSRCCGIHSDKTALCRYHLAGCSGRERITDWKREELIMIKNERIKIYPASREQMEKNIASETNKELKKAYGEMLEGCLVHPGEWDWYAMWMIEKMDGVHIGDLCFKGIEAGRNPEIGYGILKEYRGLGFATEAVKLALKWAFGHSMVKAVEAEADPDNVASQRVLVKCGFRPNGEIGEEGPRYIVYGENEMDTNEYTIRLEKEKKAK